MDEQNNQNDVEQAVNKVMDVAESLADKTPTQVDDQLVDKAQAMVSQNIDKVPSGFMSKLKGLFGKK